MDNNTPNPRQDETPEALPYPEQSTQEPQVAQPLEPTKPVQTTPEPSTLSNESEPSPSAEPLESTAPVEPQQQFSAPVEQPAQYAQPSHEGLAITALVLGIVSIVTLIFFPVALLAGIGAIVFGIIALKKRQSKGMSIAGIVTGAIGLLIAGVLLAITVMAYTSLQERAIESSQEAQQDWEEKEELRQQYESSSSDKEPAPLSVQ